MLLMSLMPTLSHLLQAQGPAGWAEVCSAQEAPRWGGMTRLGEAGGDAQTLPEPAMAHCPYCTLHAPDLGLPPVQQAVLPASPRPGAPPLFFQAPRTLHAWRAAQPRGPPTRA